MSTFTSDEDSDTGGTAKFVINSFRNNNQMRPRRAAATAARSALVGLLRRDGKNAAGDSPTSSDGESSLETCASPDANDGVSLNLSSSSSDSQAAEAPAPASSRSQTGRTKALSNGIKVVRNSKKANRLISQAAALSTPGTGDSSPTVVLSSSISECDRALIDSPAGYWLRHQDALSSARAIKTFIRESYELDDGSEHDVIRTYVYFGNATLQHHARHPAWREAVNALTSCDIPHSGGLTAGKVSRHLAARVTSFKTPTYICLENARRDGMFEPLASSAPFPPVDNSIRDVISMELLDANATANLHRRVARPDVADTAAAVARVFTNNSTSPIISAADAVTFAEREKVKAWEQHQRTHDDVVAAHNLIRCGTNKHKILRLLSTDHHRAWGLLCREAFGNYSPELSIDDRVKLLEVLLALPVLHLRTLRGKHQSRTRDAHLAAQLAGLVCTPTDDAPPPPRAAAQTTSQATRHVGESKSATAENTTMDADAKRCAQVMKLATEGRIGAANKALKKETLPPVPIEKTYDNLVLLHPNGPPPSNIALPNVPLFSTDIVSVLAIRKIVKASCKEGAPGPSEWTQELLHVALQDAAFAEAFRHLVVDICNGALPDKADSSLRMSKLIGIPKATGGTRPIAMGETFLKVAAAVAIQRVEPILRVIFRGTQFGVATPNGAEVIIHNARTFIRNGQRPSSHEAAGTKRVLITLDAKNAFNNPMRDAMLHAILDYGVPGLLGVFKTAYANPGRMLVVGSEGKYAIESRRGARQGTVDGSVDFCLVLQPALDNIRDNHPGTDAQGYLDDVTLFSNTVEDAALAFNTYDTHLNAQGSSLNFQKCEIFIPELVRDGPLDEYPARVNKALDEAGVPVNSPLRQFRIVTCVKLLGASIATTSDDEREHLVDRTFSSFESHLARLSQLPASPQAFALMRSCLLPSMSFVSRVHHPDVTRDLMRQLDARVVHLIQQWSQGKPFDRQQQALIHAPLKQGGLGMTSLSLTAPAANAASTLAYRGGKAVSQRHIAQACQLIFTNQLKVSDPHIAEHQECTKHAANVLTSTPSVRVSEDVMGAYLRLVLSIGSENASSSTTPHLPCPGCSNISIGRRAHNIAAASSSSSGQKLFTLPDWMRHIVGCAAVPGGHVTKRHNSVRDLLFALLKTAGYTGVGLEPRNLRSYSCGCGMILQHDAYVEHQKSCPRATLAPRSHGPDIIFTDHSGSTIAIDVRICNELCDQHRGKPIEAVFAAAAQEKARRYGDICSQAGATLVTFCVSALGALSDMSKALLKIIAKDSDVDFITLCSKVSCRTAIGTAQALLTAEGHVGIRPTPRLISQATLKMLGESLGLSLVSLAAGQAQKTRLGVTAPSDTDLQPIVNRFEAIVKSFGDYIGNVIRSAGELQTAEAAETRRLASELNPLNDVIQPRVVPIETRRPSTDRAQPPATSVAESQRRASVAAAAETRKYDHENALRENLLQLQDAEAAATHNLELIQDTVAKVEDDALQVDQLHGDTRQQAEAAAADAHSQARQLEEVARLRSATAERIEASVSALNEELERLTDADHCRTFASAKLAESRRSTSSVLETANAIISTHRADAEYARKRVDEARNSLHNASSVIREVSQSRANSHSIAFSRSAAPGFNASYYRSDEDDAIAHAHHRQKLDLEQRLRDEQFARCGVVLGQCSPEPYAPQQQHPQQWSALLKKNQSSSHRSKSVAFSFYPCVTSRGSDTATHTKATPLQLQHGNPPRATTSLGSACTSSSVPSGRPPTTPSMSSASPSPANPNHCDSPSPVNPNPGAPPSNVVPHRC